MKVRVEFKGCMVVDVGEEDEAAFVVSVSELLRCAPITKNGAAVDMRFVDVEQWYPVCRVCGCWEYEACAGGCSWVEDDLCSACAPNAIDDAEGGHELDVVGEAGGGNQ